MAMQDVISDRRLYLTADNDRIVEEGDADARFLLAGAGGTIKAAEAKRLDLGTKNGRITYLGGPRLQKPGKGEDAAERVDPDPHDPKILELGDPTGGRDKIDPEGEEGTGSAERAPPKGSDEPAVAAGSDERIEVRAAENEEARERGRAELEARRAAKLAELERRAVAAEAEAAKLAEALAEALAAVEAAGGAEEEADDSHRNIPEWAQRMSPEGYLKRYPNGPNAEFARAVIAARDDGADGGS